ncbi:MAG: hypothetical protein GKR92_11525 [Gammaproteobacteria bacterium]|nr:MAG: hypothetical protein GKR92_11525 [Gammaproteobacteria bacterium]
MIFLGIRVQDVLSKSHGKIIEVIKRGNIIESFRIQLDSGHIVTRSRDELFMKEKRKPLFMHLAWDADKEALET